MVQVLRCRVYVVGGAQAEGTPEDTVVAYTPEEMAPDGGIYVEALVLQPGNFWSDVIESPCAFVGGVVLRLSLL
jgi:hypothetical protein